MPKNTKKRPYKEILTPKFDSKFGNNNAHHRTLKMYPNMMEHALVPLATDENIPIMITNAKSPEAQEIHRIHTELKMNYAGDWLRFFLDWRAKAEQDAQRIVDEVRDRSQQTIREVWEANKQTIEALKGELALPETKIADLQESLDDIKRVTDSIEYSNLVNLLPNFRTPKL